MIQTIMEWTWAVMLLLGAVCFGSLIIALTVSWIKVLFWRSK